MALTHAGTRLLLYLLLLTSFLAPSLGAKSHDLYKLLGVTRSASETELKRAYRKESKKYHPDKNPNNQTAHDRFVEITAAYEDLSDPQLRRVYDQHGKEALDRHKQQQAGPGGAGGGHRDPFDFFSRFFGNQGGFQQGVRRGPDLEVRIQIPLADFYNGNPSLEFEIEKQMLCDKCQGTGSADGRMETCGSCGGQGVRIHKHMIAPGMFQQVQMACGDCGGRGQMISKPCSRCGGRKVERRRTTHEVVIEPGLPRGSRLRFEGDAEEGPDFEPGDLIVHVEEKEPERRKGGNDGAFFRRRGADLFWREVLGLREAWMGGWRRQITHLDGRVVEIGRPARGEGVVVQPGTVEKVKGKGMPGWEGRPAGDLYVEYSVVLPDKMDKPMEKDFREVWDRWRKKGVLVEDVGGDIGRPPLHDADEL